MSFTGNKSLNTAQIEQIVGQPVVDFVITSGSNQGDNVGGSLLSIQVTTMGGENLNVVYKCLPLESNDETEDSHYIVRHRIKSVFRIETCMYEKIFPLVEQIISKNKSEGHISNNIQLSIPKYISGYNDNFKNDYVCLEDLRPQGFLMQDKHKSLTYGEVALVMKEIAKFHALTYSVVRYEGEKIFEEDKRIRLLKYNCLTEEGEEPLVGETFSKMFKNYFENTAELLRNLDRECAERVEKFTAKHDHNSFHNLRRSTHNRTDKNAFACIIHGDLWINNILFKYKQDGEKYRDDPTELKFIDFQLSRRSNVYEELGYFFWTSTTPEFRKLHLINMLHIYHSSFERALKVVGLPLPVGFTKGCFLDGFYECMIPAYLYMPFALSLQMMGDMKSVKEQEVEASHGQLLQEKMEKNEGKNWEILGNDKKLHKLRILTSPRALQRLFELTREMVELELI